FSASAASIFSRVASLSTPRIKNGPICFLGKGASCSTIGVFGGIGAPQIRNPNLEIRNKSQIANSKNKSMQPGSLPLFGFRICFGFRDSSFGFTLQVNDTDQSSDRNGLSTGAVRGASRRWLCAPGTSGRRGAGKGTCPPC